MNWSSELHELFVREVSCFNRDILRLYSKGSIPRHSDKTEGFPPYFFQFPQGGDLRTRESVLKHLPRPPPLVEGVIHEGLYLLRLDREK
jgi:hypothetical protein